MKTTDNINVLIQSMWGYRVIQYADANAYALQEYRDDGKGLYHSGGQLWYTIESSRLKSFIFKKFQEFTLDANPSTKV